MEPATRIVASDDVLQIKVLVATEIAIDQRWYYDAVFDTYWRLYVNSAPGAKVVARGRDYPLGPGLVHLVPPWLRFDCRNVRAMSHFFIHFDLVGFPGSLVRRVFPEPMALGPDAALRGEIATIREAIARASLTSLPLLLRMKAATHAALAAAIARLPRDRLALCQAASDGRQDLAPALAYIDFGIQRPFTNAELARICGMGESRFIRRFREALGQTPAQYIIERRVAWAAERLRRSDEPIDDIAVRAGFPDRFYFTRVFARRMGVSPARYRRLETV